MLSVIMTTYKEKSECLKQSIESILNQTFSDFTFIIIVDDPGNTNSINIVRKYAEADQRINYYINDRNMGLAKSLNKGIELVSTRYIARMDADDISLPNRFEKEIEFLESHPSIDIVGSFCKCIDENGNFLFNKDIYPCSTEMINKVLKYINCFVHPSLMGRSKVFKELKYRKLKYTEDYDMLCRAVQSNYKLYNLSTFLLYYRISSNVPTEKSFRQEIERYFIQNHFSRGDILNKDISAEYYNEMRNINVKRCMKSVLYYRKASAYFHKKMYLQTLICLLIAFVSSKYQRKTIINVLKYYCLLGKIKRDQLS